VHDQQVLEVVLHAFEVLLYRLVGLVCGEVIYVEALV